MYNDYIDPESLMLPKGQVGIIWQQLFGTTEQDELRKERLRIAKLKRQILQEQLAALRGNRARHQHHHFNGKAS